MDGQVDYVDQLCPQQRLPENAVAEGQQVSSFLLLKPGYRGDGVTPDEGRVTPVGAY